MKTQLATTAAVSKALGHRGRLRVIALLGHGQMSVCQMAAALAMPVSTLSGLLLELRRTGLVIEERRGSGLYTGVPTAPGSRLLLEVILTGVRDDPQVRRDATLAAKLRRTSPAAACAALKEQQP